MNDTLVYTSEIVNELYVRCDTNRQKVSIDLGATTVRMSSTEARRLASKLDDAADRADHIKAERVEVAPPPGFAS